MTVEESALAWARARVRGPLPVDVAAPMPDGMLRATEGDRAWLLPTWPDGATPALLAEYDVAPLPVDKAGQARRVLAATLRCCWRELDSAPWPGTASPIADVLAVYALMARGTTDEETTALVRRWALGDLRRLADSGWTLLDEDTGTVRPGPRLAQWPDESLGVLRDLIRRLPQASETTTTPPAADSEATAAAAEDAEVVPAADVEPS